MKTAVVVPMSCNENRSQAMFVCIIPNVETYEEAYQKAAVQYDLKGEWAEQVGISFLPDDPSKNFKVTLDSDYHEAYFHNGERRYLSHHKK